MPPRLCWIVLEECPSSSRCLSKEESFCRADRSRRIEAAVRCCSGKRDHCCLHDFDEEKIYWADAYYDKIERTDLDGNFRQVLTTGKLETAFFKFLTNM